MGMFEIQIENLFRQLGTHQKMVLSTSAQGHVTSRMMSLIILDSLFYFQTDKNSRKYKQLCRNDQAALCMDHLQIEGFCTPLGHPLENLTFCSQYRQHYPNSYQKYTRLPEESLFAFQPTFIKRWGYDNGEPYEEFFQFAAKTYRKQKYLH